MSAGRSKSRSATGTALGAVPYGVDCACGRQHTGVRDSEYQVLECDACGRRLFVLPVSPYPAIDDPFSPMHDDLSQRKRRDRKPKRRANRGGGKRETQRAASAVKPAGTINAVATQTVEKPASAAIAESRLAVPRRKLVTPLRLVIFGIAIVLAGTGIWKYRQSVRAQAERDFREQADLGEAALKDHDFSAAFTAYRKAVAALDKLNRDDGKARHVRQMFRESRAASELAAKTLPEIADELRTWAADDPDGWKQRFHSNYAGRWIVLDTQVSRVRTEADGDVVRIDFPLAAGDHPVDLIVTGTAFASLKLEGKPLSVILGAEIATCESSGERFVIRFNPESAFLWTDFENYRALGFTVAPDPQEGAPHDEDDIATERIVRDRLLSQAKLMGLSE